jgi:hypothetical protein
MPNRDHQLSHNASRKSPIPSRPKNENSTSAPAITQNMNQNRNISGSSSPTQAHSSHSLPSPRSPRFVKSILPSRLSNSDQVTTPPEDVTENDDSSKKAINITVHSCASLPNTDIGSLTDAFVKVKILNKNKSELKRFKTRIIEDDLNPQFEENFGWCLPDTLSIGEVGGWNIQFGVYDNSGAFIGEVICPMVNFLELNDSKKVTLPLAGRKGQKIKVSGTISFTVSYVNVEDVTHEKSELMSSILTYTLLLAANSLLQSGLVNVEVCGKASTGIGIGIPGLLVSASIFATHSLNNVPTDFYYEQMLVAEKNLSIQVQRSIPAKISALFNVPKRLLDIIFKVVEKLLRSVNQAKLFMAKGGFSEVGVGVDMSFNLKKIIPPPNPVDFEFTASLEVKFLSENQCIE